MIEDEKTVGNHENHLRQLKFIGLRRWDFGFEEMNRFIAEETDGAAAEAGYPWERIPLIARHQFAALIQGVPRYFSPPFLSRFDDSQFAPVTFYHHPRV